MWHMRFQESYIRATKEHNCAMKYSLHIDRITLSTVQKVSRPSYHCGMYPIARTRGMIVNYLHRNIGFSISNFQFVLHKKDRMNLQYSQFLSRVVAVNKYAQQ